MTKYRIVKKDTISSDGKGYTKYIVQRRTLFFFWCNLSAYIASEFWTLEEARRLIDRISIDFKTTKTVVK